MHDEHHEQKTSLYLVRRAEALRGALRHFQAAGSDAVGKRLRFLAQSDFWEWEVENLVYSFSNLAERSHVWEADEFAIRKLGQLGIKLDTKLAKRVRWRGGWRLDTNVQRVAPIELLEQVIAVWNELIEQCEAHFVRPMQEKARKYGIETCRDLAHLRKTMPALGQEANK
jgi:hypothetical protein